MSAYMVNTILEPDLANSSVSPARTMCRVFPSSFNQALIPIIITVPCMHTVVQVGFDPVDYVVAEPAGEVVLTVRIFNGTLQREITVLFETDPGTATQIGT